MCPASTALYLLLMKIHFKTLAISGHGFSAWGEAVGIVAQGPVKREVGLDGSGPGW